MAVFMFFFSSDNFLRPVFLDVAHNVTDRNDVNRENWVSVGKIFLSMMWKRKFEKLLVSRTDIASSRENSSHLDIFDSFWLGDLDETRNGV